MGFLDKVFKQKAEKTGAAPSAQPAATPPPRDPQKSALGQELIRVLDRAQSDLYSYQLLYKEQRDHINHLIKNADLTERDDDGDTALLIAIKKDFSRLHQELMKRGSDINAQNYLGETPLILALTKSNITLAMDLIKRGASTVGKTRTGKTVLSLALEQNVPEVIEILLGNNGSPDVQNDDGTPLIVDVVASTRVNILQILLDHNVKLDAQKKDGDTALITALRQCTKGYLNQESAARYKEMARRLLAKGADPFITNAEGKTALDYAKAAGLQEFVDQIEAISAQEKKEQEHLDAGLPAEKDLGDIIIDPVKIKRRKNSILPN